MPGVNMWAFFFLFLNVFFQSLSTSMHYPTKIFIGPIFQGPRDRPAMAQSQQCQLCECKYTHRHPEKCWVRLQSVLMCSKVLVWDVIVVLCVEVSTDRWTDGPNDIRMIKWWMMTFWGIERVCTHPFLVCNVCVSGFRCLTHPPLLVHMGWEHIVAY